MLTRRGFATCALCALSGFVATAAEADSAPAPTAGLKRTILQRTDGPTSGYETVLAAVEIAPGATVARHTHPGVESSYLVEGQIEFLMDGQPSRMLNPGDGFQVPVAVPHSAKNGEKPARLVGTYVVEKGKPLASPA
jgi:quercetin dioxygenase-like cupin family protein